MKPLVLIIGIGNPLRGDDGLGRRAAAELERTLPPGSADVVGCHQLTPELALSVAESQRVIFIDASVGEPAGKITVERLAPAANVSSDLSHTLNPLGLMRYSLWLYRIWPETYTISVNGEAFGLNDKLSTPVQAAIPFVLTVARELALGGEPMRAECAASVRADARPV